MPSLVRQETAPGSNEFTATLFDLIRRGRYKSTASHDRAKSVWGGLRHEDVADLQLSLGDTSVPLTDFEQPVAEVIDSVLTGEADRLSEFRDRIESDRTGNSKRFTAFKKAVGDTIDAKGWFARGGLRILGIGIVVFGLIAVVLLWTGIHGFRSVVAALERRRPDRARTVRRDERGLLIVAASKAPLWRRRTDCGPDAKPSAGRRSAAT